MNKAKEAVLKEDLHTMRAAIDSYTVDKEKAPQSLDDLVQAGYLKTIPMDPMTSRNDTWMAGQSENAVDDRRDAGRDRRRAFRGAESGPSDGTSYNTW